MSLRIDVIELPEPLLEFGSVGASQDPKIGLQEFGPLSLRFGAAHREHVRVGLVGTVEMLDHAKQWFERCAGYVRSSSENQALHPDFLGFEKIFRASLDLSRDWTWEINLGELKTALDHAPNERFNAVLDLYERGMHQIRGERPEVIVVCLSKEVIEACRNVRAPKLTREEQKLMRRQQLGQLALPGLEELVEIQDTLLYRDFRRALKARAMDVGTPIQIGTDNLFLDSDGNENPASRAWNVSLALFYKAGGLPWRLKTPAPETCFVGVSFHHLRTRQRNLVFSSLAQAFPTTGEGFALRGDTIPWQRNSDERSPHLNEEQAARLARKVLEHYRQRVGSDPTRMVFFKTSKFDALEQVGLRGALSHIPVLELVNLRASEFRLVRRGAYPPRRGTVTTVNDTTRYLFTNGYYTPWHTYMGAHVPVPYEVNDPSQKNSMDMCNDVLGLTKLNWNTARPFTSAPIPLHFAREVGSIMSHYAELRGDDAEPEPAYRFYM